MTTKRIIACLDVDRGRVVKGVRFRELRDKGDPSELAVRYEAEGADEVVFLDITASTEERETLLDAVRRTAERLFIPLCVGGGIRSVADVKRALDAGADKVAINSAAVVQPQLLTDAADRFGSQCVVASIDAQRDDGSPSGYRVYTHGGQQATDLDAIDWAVQCAELGAGEILLTAIDRDGVRSGFDTELYRLVSEQVTTRMIASGGAGLPEHFSDVLQYADAALAAGIFHDNIVSIAEAKDAVKRAGLPVRPVTDTMQVVT